MKAGGQRFLAMGQKGRILVLELTSAGETVYRDTTLFEVKLQDSVGGVPGASLDRIPRPRAFVVFDNAQAFIDGELTFSDDFAEKRAEDWTYLDFELGGAQWGEGVVTVIAGDVVLSGTLLEEFATDIWLGKGAIGGIQLISSVGDSMSFHLDEASNEAIATVPSELIIDRIPFEVRPWLRYRLSLQLQDSKLVSTLSYPVIVSYIESELPGFGAAAAIDNLIAFTAGKTRFTVLDDGSQDRTSEFDTPTSEIRAWSTDDGNRMGLCFPDQNRVLIGRPSVSSFSGTLTWPQETAQTSIVLGTGAGHEDGALFFPLSVDRGPDGRYFVLDAGNARIQVFDAEGNYLTQWGRDGFDFGNGNVSTDFVGSIAVDDDGFICVADVGNRRTQKFAPESLDKWRLLPTRHVAQHFHHLLRR